MTRCLNDPERDGLNAHDEGSVWTDDLFHGGQAFIEYPERIGLFQVDAAGTCCFLECIEVERSVGVVGDESNVDFSFLAVIL